MHRKHRHHKHGGHRKHSSKSRNTKSIDKLGSKNVEVDKEACGDHQKIDVAHKVHRKREHSKSNKQAKSKDEAQKKPTTEELLEKIEKTSENLIEKTKKFFRKEKSSGDLKKGEPKNPVNNDKKEQRKRKHRHHHHSHKDNEKPPKDKIKKPLEPDASKFCGNVQEVIYCEVQQCPYILKNDKSHSALKDLYKREPKTKHRSHSRRHEDRKIVEHPLPYKEKSHSKHHHHKYRSESAGHPQPPNLGPYKDYFCFEQKDAKHHHHHKRKVASDKNIKAPEDKKKKPAKEGEKTKKVHEKMEDDLKGYFTKLQTMIDTKLDSILQSNKPKEQKESKKEDVKVSRSKSETKDTQPKKEKHKEHRHKTKPVIPYDLLFPPDLWKQKLQMMLTPGKPQEPQYSADSIHLQNDCQICRHVHNYPQHHNFVVQGIEPPSLESSRRKSKASRRLECKTVSIIGIPPQVVHKNLVETNETQTNKSLKSSAPVDELVEKRKKSKRFKIYYKYSQIDNMRHSSSDARSIISDSCRAMSDPSDVEDKVTQTKALQTTKKNLNNIIEEPSELVKPCYLRMLSSSNSDYCLKIEKKAKTSDVSVQSKPCAYCKHNIRSKSDFRISSKATSKMFRSKSDVFIDATTPKQVIKSIFLNNNGQRFARSQRMKRLNHFQPLVRTNIECQTSDVKVKKQEKSSKDKRQQQFQEIYKTIDDLEESIGCPIETADAECCTQTKITEEKGNDAKGTATLDIAVGTPKSSNKTCHKIETCNRTTKTEDSLLRVDTGVGTSRSSNRSCHRRETAIETSQKSICRPPSKVLKSRAVSPIYVTESSQPKPSAKPKTNVRSRDRKPTAESKLPKPMQSQSPTKKAPTFPKPKQQFVVVQDDQHARNVPPSPKQQKTSVKSHEDDPILIKPIYGATKNSDKAPTRPNVYRRQKTDVCRKSSKSLMEACLHTTYSDHKRKIRSAGTTRTPNSGQVAIHTAVMHFNQPKMKKSLSTTSSSVGEHVQVATKSKSLVEISVQKMYVGLEASKSNTDCSPKLHAHNSKSNVESLDHYVENKFTSRLFLTKDYKGSEISAYQKRKIYDDAIRKKMRKKFRFSKGNIGPQIFEVRFLSMVDNNKESVTTDVDYFQQQTRDQQVAKKDQKSSVTEIFVQGSKGNEQKILNFCRKLLEVNSSLEFPEEDQCSCAKFSSNCQACKNFLDLLETLCNSISTYCDSPKEVETACIYENPLDTAYNCSTSTEDATKGGQSSSPVESDSLILTSVNASNPLRLSEPLSCPMLVRSLSSFKFLYKEEEDPLFSNQTQFDFSLRQYNVEAPLREIGSSSEESGYDSIRSRTPSSIKSFFKKPKIVALLRTSSLTGDCNPKTLNRKLIYDRMSKNCQLYANKVRRYSETKLNESKEDFDELPLTVLLGKTSSSHITVNKSNETLTSISSPSLKEEVKGEENCYATSGCKLVLNNHSLKVDSVTHLEPKVFSKENSDTEGVTADSSTCQFAPENVRTFFACLLNEYEREVQISTRLFENVEFYEKRLLPSIKKEAMCQKKAKRSIFGGLFKRKEPPKLEPETTDKDSSCNECQEKLQSLATFAKKSFSMLAQAVKSNKNIDDEIKIYGLLRLLERIENGDFKILQNNSKLSIDDDIEEQVIRAFVNVYSLAKQEAKKRKRSLNESDINLIKAFVSKYRIGLLSKTDIIACYIGRGDFLNESQLKGAVTYLMRSESHVDIKEFEDFCKVQSC